MSIGIFLSLESEAFNGFKQDFKTILNNTFETMQEKDVDKATVTAKFEIALIPGINPNTDAPDSAAERSFVAPMIKHKITANMKLQSEKAGVLGGPDGSWYGTDLPARSPWFRSKAIRRRCSTMRMSTRRMTCERAENHSYRRSP